MKVKRRYLYTGVFFLAMGAVLVAAELNGIDENTAAELLKLWPVLIIGAGLALLFRKTRFGLAGGLLVAAIPGVMFGMLFALGPTLAIGCGNDQPGTFATDRGTFTGTNASVSLVMSCGDFTVNTQPGNQWSLESGNTRGYLASIDSSPTNLSIGPETNRIRWFGRNVWRLTLPTDTPMDLSLELNAAKGQATLTNAQLTGLHMTVNAGDQHISLANATLARLDARLNAGSLRITLPAADFTGDLSVNAGDMRLCPPSNLGVRVHSDVTLGSVDTPGFVNRGGYLESSNYQTADRHADLSVTVNLGSVKLDTNGGC